MGGTNAISSVIIVGAILAAGPLGHDTSKIFGIIGVLASINIFGGFLYISYAVNVQKPKRRRIKKCQQIGRSFISYFSINVYICS